MNRPPTLPDLTGTGFTIVELSQEELGRARNESPGLDLLLFVWEEEKKTGIQTLQGPDASLVLFCTSGKLSGWKVTGRDVPTRVALTAEFVRRFRDLSDQWAEQAQARDTQTPVRLVSPTHLKPNSN